MQQKISLEKIGNTRDELKICKGRIFCESHFNQSQANKDPQDTKSLTFQI